jgi:glycosyltransferase involved in cell wall biosynthesis
MVTPTVTVVMPTFNHLEYLRVAVASVYAQTFDDWELVIVDDGSDEETRRFLRAPHDSRMRVVFGSHTGVPAVVRNRGIAEARGRYVAFLDSDDQWAADKLRRQLALMAATPARRWSYTAVRKIDIEGRSEDVQSWAPHSGSILEQILRLDAKIATPTVVADVSLVRELGGFDERMRFIEDYDLWARLAMRSEVSADATPLSDIRNHPGRFTSDLVGGERGWVGFYAKMEKLVPTRRLRELCRRQKRERFLQLAAQQARVRDWGGMARTLAAAALVRAWSPGGWLHVARVAARSGRHEGLVPRLESRHR